jgi:hypothetical protein
MTQKPSEEGKRQAGAGVLGAEELWRRYLRIRAERDTCRNETDNPVTKLKKADTGISPYKIRQN